MTLTKKQPCPKKEYQKIGFDLKLSIIDQITNGQISVNHAAKLHGISRSSITYWMKKLRSFEQNSKTMSKNQELKKLKERIEELEEITKRRRSSRYPEPNGASLGNSSSLDSALAAWNGSNTRPSHLDSGMVRIDHALTSRITLFGRYNDSPSSNQFGAIVIDRLDLRFRSLSVGLNLRPNSRWTVDLRANESQADTESGWSRTGQPSSSGCDLEPMTSYLFPAAGSCDQLLRTTRVWSE